MIDTNTITDLPGLVIAINGEHPGPASGISYDVAVRTANGGEQVLQNIAPKPDRRWPDQLNTVPVPVGAEVTIRLRLGTMQMLPPGEQVQTEECEEPNP